jgi:hypothetical protein
MTQRVIVQHASIRPQLSLCWHRPGNAKEAHETGGFNETAALIAAGTELGDSLCSTNFNETAATAPGGYP